MSFGTRGHELVHVRTDDFLRTKISWKHRLPYFLTHGSPLCALRARESSATVHIFFRTAAVIRKLFDTSFSYKHCNFLHGCLLVKMASKTVTSSILYLYSPNSITLKYSFNTRPFNVRLPI